MTVLLIVGLIFLGAVLWGLLERHERRRAQAGLPRHSGLRLIFAAAALLTALFSGGCGVLFLANMDGTYVTLPTVLIFAGPPFLVGLLIWWLAIRRKPAIPPA